MDIKTAMEEKYSDENVKRAKKAAKSLQYPAPEIINALIDDVLIILAELQAKQKPD